MSLHLEFQPPLLFPSRANQRPHLKNRSVVNLCIGTWSREINKGPDPSTTFYSGQKLQSSPNSMQQNPSWKSNSRPSSRLLCFRTPGCLTEAHSCSLSRRWRWSPLFCYSNCCKKGDRFFVASLCEGSLDPPALLMIWSLMQHCVLKRLRVHWLSSAFRILDKSGVSIHYVGLKKNHKHMGNDLS